MKRLKKLIIVVIIITVSVAGFFAVRQFRSQRQAELTNWQTVSIERGSVAATVGATGTVRTNQSASLTWRTTGTVGKVNLGAGAKVSSGQELASLAQTSLPQNVILAQADLVSAQRTLEDLLNSQLQQAQALQAVEGAQQALEDLLNPELAQARALEAIADAQKNVENAERALRWAQSPASQSLIDQAEAQVVIAKDQLDRAREKFTPYAHKPEDNLTRARLQSQLSTAQQQYDAAVRQLNGLQGTASLTEQTVKEADLETARAQLLQAEREWERLKDGPSPAEVALLEAQLADAQRQWGRLQDGPDPTDIAAAEARIAAAQATLDQDRITAPFEGVLTDVISKPGDQVNPGTLAFRLDDLSRLLVDVQVSEVDINQIQVGQPVILTFDAILAAEYHGEVVEVSSVGEIQQGVVSFKATVELIDADEWVKPGMTAAANVVINQLQDALLVPNRAVRIKDGKRVVYVLRSGAPEAVEIELGASSETVSEVLDGDLQVGDQVVLNPPTIFEQSGPPGFMR